MRTLFRLLAVTLPLLALAARGENNPAWPAAPGAVFAFRDANFATPVVAYDAKGRSLMAFQCVPRGRGLYGRFYDLVCDGGSFQALEAGPWVGLQVAKSGAFTIEATITPAQVPSKAPGAIVAYGNEEGEDAALIQDESGLALRLNKAKPIALFPLEAGKPVHVLVACGQGKWAAYRDGQPAGAGTLPDNTPAWGTRQLVMGSAWSGADLWRGRLEGIALFSRALTAGEAAGEASAMKALQAGRKPATVVRFRGSLLRQAETSAPESIKPYTRSLTAAEYKVDQVLAGEWKKPTITVLHWMIMDSKRLPLADRKPGTKVTLTVEPLDEHPEIESNRRDELPDTDADAQVFYCESEDSGK